MTMKSWLLKSHMVTCMVAMFLLTAVMGFLWKSKNCFFLIEISIFNFSFLSVPVIFLVDQWSLLFFFTVLLISFSVFIFSKSYMMMDVNFLRFHLILWLFVVSMLLLIFSPGFFSLILGWDGLGLSSFLLVIYYKNFKSLNAGMLTFMTNRLGDGFMLTGMFCSVMVISFNLFSAESSWLSTPMFYLLVLGSLTKSAQIPFSAWLPAAMAAPTPVSSLVHSSTLVTAGVYVIFRMSDLLSENMFWLLLILGTLTMLMASISALSETDMKKIVALSTLSQLGLMIVALGSSQPSLSFFHLITHAFFKAMMFIGVGVIMHSSSSYQDFKVMGYSSYTPVVLGVISGANLSLCGLPFFSGFFSKEMILQSSSLLTNCSLMFSVMFIVSIILTQVYSIRFIMKVFFFSMNFISNKNFSEMDFNSLCAMMILFLPACLMGSFMSMSLKVGFDFFSDPSFLKISVCLLFLVSAALGFLIFKEKFNNPKKMLFFNMWLLPLFSGMFFSKVFFSSDKNYKNFLNNLSESTVLYMFKLLSSTVFTKISVTGDKIMKFSIMIAMLLVFMNVCPLWLI